jgi:hypothetical protein
MNERDIRRLMAVADAARVTVENAAADHPQGVIENPHLRTLAEAIAHIDAQ